MQVDDDVSQEDIKTAYRQAAKYCHPDVNDAGHELCILLNEVHSWSLTNNWLSQYWQKIAISCLPVQTLP